MMEGAKLDSIAVSVFVLNLRQAGLPIAITNDLNKVINICCRTHTRCNIGQHATIVASESAKYLKSLSKFF